MLFEPCRRPPRYLSVLFAATAALLSAAVTGCKPSVTSQQNIQAKSNAGRERALAEDKARVAAGAVEESAPVKESQKRVGARDADNSIRSAEDARRAEKEKASKVEEEMQELARATEAKKMKSEALQVEQKTKERDARNVQFGQAGKIAVERWIQPKIQERRDTSIIAEVEAPDATYLVEVSSPRYEIWPCDLEVEKASLSPADKLNGKLGGVEWRGVLFLDAAAYRVIKKTESQTKKRTVNLWNYKRPDYENGKWQDFHAVPRLGIPFIRAYRIEKADGEWKIEEDESLTTKAEFLGTVAQGEAASSLAPRLAAEGFLGLKPSGIQPNVSDDNNAEEAEAEFERHVFTRTPETLILKSEEQESKVVTNGTESPFYIARTTTEYHAPIVILDAAKLTDADRLNGVQWRGRVLLKFDSSRVVEITPAPYKRTSYNDGTWNSGGHEEFLAAKVQGQWSFARKIDRTGFRLLKK